MLAAKKNSHINIVAQGEGAQEAIDELVKAFDNKFGE
tara:strand:- start:614 stop:724 length:111 start_codon:yes stop_codon:yes gene_type:complete